MAKPYKYLPERWVVIKLQPVDGSPHHYRVFGTWGGTYTSGQSWQMNSGITSIEEDSNYYYFNGSSGSVYCCPKGNYGFFSYGLSVLHNMVESNRDIITITEMPKDTNWMELEYEPKHTNFNVEDDDEEL